MAKKITVSKTKPQPRKISEKDFLPDFVFEDAKEVNAPIIARIKESGNKYLLHLLSIHNPLFYIFQGKERLNSGETEDVYYFTYFDGLMAYTFVENVSPGKATFVIQTAITKNSDGRNFNFLMSQVKSYFSSRTINKRSKLISFELRPFSGFHLGYDRVSHVDFDRWKRLLKSKFMINKPNAVNLIPAKAPACSPAYTIQTHRNVQTAQIEKKKIRYIKVGHPQLFVNGKMILLTADINSNVAFRISSFIRSNGGKIAPSNTSDYNVAIVSSREALEFPKTTLCDISHKVRMKNIPVIIAGDLMKLI